MLLRPHFHSWYILQSSFHKLKHHDLDLIFKVTNDMRTLYKITKTLKGDYGTTRDVPVKTSEGQTTSDESEIIKRWKEHFEKILNRPEPAVLPHIAQPRKE